MITNSPPSVFRLTLAASLLGCFAALQASSPCDPGYDRLTDGYTIPLHPAPTGSGVTGQWRFTSGTATHIIEVQILDDGIPSNSQYFQVQFLFRVEGSQLDPWLPFHCSDVGPSPGQPVRISFVALGTFDGVLDAARNLLSRKFGRPILLDFEGSHPSLTCLSIRCLNEDSDADGVPNNQDLCPDSNLNQFVVIGDLHTSVANDLDPSDDLPVSVDANGCSLADHLEIVLACAAVNAVHPKKPDTVIHGRFISNLAFYLNNLVRAGMITGRDHGAIIAQAAQTDPSQFLP